MNGFFSFFVVIGLSFFAFAESGDGEATQEKSTLEAPDRGKIAVQASLFEPTKSVNLQEIHKETLAEVLDEEEELTKNNPEESDEKTIEPKEL